MASRQTSNQKRQHCYGELTTFLASGVGVGRGDKSEAFVRGNQARVHQRELCKCGSWEALGSLTYTHAVPLVLAFGALVLGSWDLGSGELSSGGDYNRGGIFPCQ